MKKLKGLRPLLQVCNTKKLRAGNAARVLPARLCYPDEK